MRHVLFDFPEKLWYITLSLWFSILLFINRSMCQVTPLYITFFSIWKKIILSKFAQFWFMTVGFRWPSIAPRSTCCTCIIAAKMGPGTRSISDSAFKKSEIFVYFYDGRIYFCPNMLKCPYESLEEMKTIYRLFI